MAPLGQNPLISQAFQSLARQGTSTHRRSQPPRCPAVGDGNPWEPFLRKSGKLCWIDDRIGWFRRLQLLMHEKLLTCSMVLGMCWSLLSYTNHVSMVCLANLAQSPREISPAVPMECAEHPIATPRTRGEDLLGQVLLLIRTQPLSTSQGVSHCDSSRCVSP